MVEICTVGGRIIIVTLDHKIMTKRGWVEAGDLNLQTEVAIYISGSILFFWIRSIKSR